MKQINFFIFIAFFVFVHNSAVFAQKPGAAASARQNRLQEFYRWWQDDSPDKPKSPYKTESFSYLKLKPYKQQLDLPAGFKSKSFESLILHESANTKLILVVPKESDQPAKTEAERQTLFERCSGNQSLLVALPTKSFSFVNLNANCSMSYGTDEVDLKLYWVPENGQSAAAAMPHIEITTNAPACVPSELYSFDRDKKQYVLAKERCGG